MRKDAEAHADEDKQKLELIDARNEADATIYEVEKLLKEHEAKIGASEKEAVQAAVERTKQAASKEDVQAIRQAVSDLKAAAQALAQYVQGDGGGRRRRSGRRSERRGWRRQGRAGRRDRCGVRGEEVRPASVMDGPPAPRGHLVTARRSLFRST